MKNPVRLLCIGLLLFLSVSVFSACGDITQDDVISALEEINSLLGEYQEDETETTVPAIETTDDNTKESGTDTLQADSETDADTETETTDVTEQVVTYGEYYYDVENVVLYLDIYGELPDNYMTKEEAEDLGWQGGSVEKYQDGAAIGGDRFRNYENLLPDSEWIECDIGTEDENSRGAKRLVFSLEDGLYYYTDDHYETFIEVYITEDGQVEYK